MRIAMRIDKARPALFPFLASPCQSIPLRGPGFDQRAGNPRPHPGFQIRRCCLFNSMNYKFQRLSINVSENVRFVVISGAFGIVTW